MEIDEILGCGFVTDEKMVPAVLSILDYLHWKLPTEQLPLLLKAGNETIGSIGYIVRDNERECYVFTNSITYKDFICGK